MRRWFKRFWQWLLKQLRVGSKKSKQLPKPRVYSQLLLSNAEYEQILMELLEQVARGTTPGAIQGFLIGKNLDEADLAQWLNTFAQTVLNSPAEYEELASRLIGLSKVTKGKLAEISRNIGIQLLNKENTFNIDHNNQISQKQIESEEFFSNDEHNTWFEQGNRLFEEGQYEEAIASYEKAIEIQPDFYEAWSNRGLALAELQRYEEAIASYEKAIEIQPDGYEAWFNRGFALNELQRYEEAIASFEKAIEIKPDDYSAWSNRGNALRYLQRHEDAIASYDQVIKIKPDFYHPWYGRGLALTNLQRYKEAIASYDRVIEIQPDDYSAWYNRGNTLRYLQRYEDAIASYDRAIEIQPDYYSAWDNRGLALDELQRYEDAIASFEKAIEIQPDDYQAWSNRGVTLAKLQRYEDAIASFEKAIEIQPDNYQAWGNRGNAAGESIGCDRFLAESSLIARQNPQLNQRGYEGSLISYREGLKYVLQDADPRGWGILHQAIGNAHYFHWKYRETKNARYWQEALQEYHQAHITLVDFPELHLDLLQYFIRAYLDVNKLNETEEIKRRAYDVLQSLIAQQQSPTYQKILALKYAWLEQYTVDLAIQKEELINAWQIAEKGKNTCLTWLLTSGEEETEIDSPDYARIGELLTPSTAIIYWHFSPSSLYTFIIKYEANSPLIIENRERASQKRQQLQEWLDNWNNSYLAHSKQKEEANTSWRDNLAERLVELKNILQINAIVQQLNDITDLILIPHQELHCLPLSNLFPLKAQFTITHLPSIQFAFQQNQTTFSITRDERILSVECPASQSDRALIFSEIESAMICRLFKQPTRILEEQSTIKTVAAHLSQPHQIFHFTGHGNYDFNNPKQSALILTNEEQLTLETILKLPFAEDNYKIVTLSACETALTGNQTITTEYVGLVSGFLRWGASYILSTQWQVEDAANALLTIKFYRLLLSDEQITPPLALKKATKWLRNLTVEQLKVVYQQMRNAFPENEGTIRPFLRTELYKLNQRGSTTKLYAHPYYWAGYTITGRF